LQAKLDALDPDHPRFEARAAKLQSKLDRLEAHQEKLAERIDLIPSEPESDENTYMITTFMLGEEDADNTAPAESSDGAGEGGGVDKGGITTLVIGAEDSDAGEPEPIILPVANNEGDTTLAIGEEDPDAGEPESIILPNSSKHEPLSLTIAEEGDNDYDVTSDAIGEEVPDEVEPGVPLVMGPTGTVLLVEPNFILPPIMAPDMITGQLRPVLEAEVGDSSDDEDDTEAPLDLLF